MEKLKNHVKNVLEHRNTIIEERKDQNDRGLIIFKYLRPFIIKLFFHSILIFLSVRAYLNFIDSSTQYDTFVNTLNEKVVTDIKIQDYSQNCTDGYQDINTTYFPEILNGCRCDYSILPANLCAYLKENNATQEQANKMNENCNNIDQNLNKLSANSRRIQNKISTDLRHLELDEKNEFKVNLPKNCPCFQKFKGISTKKEIDRFFAGKRICILKDKQMTTLKYLQSINKNNCSATDRCQNFFCKEGFKSNKCPLVDVYTTYFNQQISPSNANSTEDTNYSFNRSQIRMVPTTEYNKTFFESKTLENLVFVPILGMAISRNGRCNIKDDSNLHTDYSAINNIDCPRDQTYYDFYTEDLKVVLNNNDKYFDKLENQLPLFSKIVNIDVKWSLSLKYAFYRNTIGCLLSEYSNINVNNVFQGFTSTEAPTHFEMKRFQLRNILSVFIDFMQTYNFQNNMQVAILIINCIVVLFNLIIIFYKIMILCCRCPRLFEVLAQYESAFSFFLDLVIAILGGVSYFIIKQFIDLIEKLLETDCIDNRVQYQFGIFNDALDATAEQNFQIFLFMIFKIAIIFLSILYYVTYKKCGFRWNNLKKVIMETINEGEDETDLEALKVEEDKDEEKNVTDKAEKKEEKMNKSVESQSKNKDVEKGAENITANRISPFLRGIISDVPKTEEDKSNVTQLRKDRDPPQMEMVNILREVNKDGEIKKVESNHQI